MATKEDIKEKFENSFLAIPDVDETLVNKNEDGSYIDKEVEFYEYWFSKGYGRATTDFLSIKSAELIRFKEEI